MRSTSLALVVLAVSALASSGCGTVANFVSMKPKVYGGLAFDAAYFAEHPPRFNITHATSPYAVLLALGIVPAELCCTAAADTVTLPLTMCLDRNWRAPKDEPVSLGLDCPVQYSPNAAPPEALALVDVPSRPTTPVHEEAEGSPRTGKSVFPAFDEVETIAEQVSRPPEDDDTDPSWLFRPDDYTSPAIGSPSGKIGIGLPW
jgi:hypothetical protein